MPLGTLVKEHTHANAFICACVCVCVCMCVCISLHIEMCTLGECLCMWGRVRLPSVFAQQVHRNGRKPGFR